MNLFVQKQTNPAELIAALKECSTSRDLKRGQYIHRQVIESALDSNISLLNTLINMYSKCGSLCLAVEVFQSMRQKDNVTWNCLIMGYVENGEYFNALELLNRMDCRPSHITYVAGLKACIGLANGIHNGMALKSGKKLHAEIEGRLFERNVIVASTLVSMYSACGNVHLAKEVFDKMKEKNVISWTSLIKGYVDNREFFTALEVFYGMDCDPTAVTFVVAVKACRGLASEVNARSESSTGERDSVLEKCLAVHRDVKRHGFETDVHVVNILIDMYSKCRNMERARNVFAKMIKKTVVTWNTLMLGYVDNGDFECALELFDVLDCQRDELTYVAFFKALGSIGSKGILEMEAVFERAKAAVETGERSFGPKAWNSLMELYCKCGKMEMARGVFNKIFIKDVVAWNCLAQGYLENGNYSEALKLLETMDCECSQVTFVIQIKACISLAKEDSEKGRVLEKAADIHKRATRQRMDTSGSVASALLEVYIKCRDMSSARDIFERMTNRNVVHWTHLIRGYVDNGDAFTGLELFWRMDCKPDEVVFLAAIKACSNLATRVSIVGTEKVIESSLRLHKEIKASGFESSLVVLNALLDMYRKLGDIGTVRDVFKLMQVKSVVSWNSLLLGYVENGDFDLALELFRRMDCEPTDVTILAVLKAYSGLAVERSGESDREEVLEKSLEIYNRLNKPEISVSNTLLNVCSKCNNMCIAKKVFDTIKRKDSVSWNCLILGYVENGESLQALETFSLMECEPDEATIVALLKACGSLGAVLTGRTFHWTICKLGLEEVSTVANTLIDFYGSCGCMSASEEVFNRLHSPSIVSWNALLTGYSSLGDSARVFSLTRNIMEAPHLRLNGVSFVCILTACSHTAKVEEGRRWFELMQRLGIDASIEHYNCMVDLFGRANRFDEALLTVRNMRLKANGVTWMSLLAASRKWNNLEVGELAVKCLRDLERQLG